MFNDLSLKEFLERNHIDSDTWEKANIEWSTLQAIAANHEARAGSLEDLAELFAKVIQKFNGVHSVRWRVKNTEHLIAKIVRKRSEANPKYTDITQDNYSDRVTDLIGVRALHLFKEDCFGINEALKAEWSLVETPVAYIREGDSTDLKNKFTEEGFEIKNHLAGYRSVHYVIESTSRKQRIVAEIQVRTLFEEGWSEIDHKVRYPNLSDNELVEYFLGIFNRMAGSADDMGGFVLGLVATVSQLEDKISVAKKEKEDVFKDMELALSQLENVREQDKASRESIATLKIEIAKLKEVNQASPSMVGLLGLGSANVAAAALVGRGIMLRSTDTAAVAKASQSLANMSKLADMAAAAEASKSFANMSKLADMAATAEAKSKTMGNLLKKKFPSQ